jgi:hypothetical protein
VIAALHELRNIALILVVNRFLLAIVAIFPEINIISKRKIQHVKLAEAPAYVFIRPLDYVPLIFCKFRLSRKVKQTHNYHPKIIDCTEHDLIVRIYKSLPKTKNRQN